MDKTIVVGLAGHADGFRLEAAAYERLARYLNRATTRLRDDPDQAEVLRDLERSVGDKLAALPAPHDRLVTITEIDGVLEEIGSVETDHDARSREGGAEPRTRRLRRIREGKQVAGVCVGLAAYAELDVAWVRTLFVLATLVTAGFFGLVYVALAFILPITSTRDA